jgi:FkbM family methyltransferase
MHPKLAMTLGVARSLRLYYSGHHRRRLMDALYSRFLEAGDLAFDVGAHVGDRVASFRRLGANVVAVEPQPSLVRVLRLLYGRDRSVVIEPVAVGRTEGAVELRLNDRNPTVATASQDFINAAKGAPGWKDQRWTRSMTVPLTTLDRLVERHGRPAFIKIDVEGFEAEALRGLSSAVPALSFEFTTIQRDAALEALEIASRLGPYHFNAALGESQCLAHPSPVSAKEMSCWLESLPQEANSGDVYAAITPERLIAGLGITQRTARGNA